MSKHKIHLRNDKTHQTACGRPLIKTMTAVREDVMVDCQNCLRNMSRKPEMHPGLKTAEAFDRMAREGASCPDQKKPE